MVYRIFADLVVILHLVFIVFSVLGGILVFWRTWIAYIHVPAAIWGSLIVIKGWICPLTPLENYLRTASGAEGYSGGFIAHYIIPIIYPEGLTRETQVYIGFIALTINIVIYIYIISRKYREANLSSEK